MAFGAEIWGKVSGAKATGFDKGGHDGQASLSELQVLMRELGERDVTLVPIEMTGESSRGCGRGITTQSTCRNTVNTVVMLADGEIVREPVIVWQELANHSVCDSVRFETKL